MSRSKASRQPSMALSAEQLLQIHQAMRTGRNVGWVYSPTATARPTAIRQSASAPRTSRTATTAAGRSRGGLCGGTLVDRLDGRHVKQ